METLTDQSGIQGTVVAKITQLSDRVKRLAAEKERLASDLGGFRVEAAQLQAENETFQTKLTEYEAMDREFRRLKGNMEREIEELRTRLQETELGRQEITHHSESVVGELSTTKKELVALTERRDVLENELTISQKLVGSLRSERDSLTLRAQTAESSLATLKREHQSTRSQLTETQTQLDSARMELDSFPPTLREKLRSDLEMTQDRISRLQADFDKQKVRLASRESALVEKDAELRNLRQHMSDVLA